MIKSFKKKNSTFTAEAEISAGLRFLAQIDILLASGEIYATVGAKMSAKLTAYDSGSPQTCATFKGYIYASVGADATIFWQKLPPKSQTIYDENNSPVRVVYHYEDGKQVSSCTRGENLKYTTSPSSRYFNPSPSYGQGSYGGTDGAGGAAEPVVIWEYEVDDGGNATITKYSGNASAVVIPEKIDGYTVTKIGNQAFKGCTSLTNIKLPDSISVIGSSAFSNTGYYNDETNWNNDVLYIGNYLIEAREEINENYTIKSGTITIATHAFSGCKNLMKITIPDGVVNIDDYAFRDCTSLTYVKIPKGVTAIRMGAFYGCSSLTSVTIPESLMYIDEAAFRNCPSLTDIYYDGSEADWLNVEIFGVNDLFNTTIHYGKRAPLKVKPVEPIIDENAGTIEIPITVTETERSDELNEVELYIAEYDEYGRFVRITLREKSVVEDDTITVKGKIPKINNYKIMLWDGNQTPLMSAIEGGTKSEGDTPEGSKLTYNIDNNEVTITGCADGITDITIPSEIDGLPVTEIASKAFYENHLLRSVYIEEGVNWIGMSTFYGCDNLVSIHIPDTLETVLDMAFGDCKKLTDITINKNSDSYVIKDGVLFDKDMMRLVLAPRNISGSYTVPEGVLVIGTSAFDCCYNLTEINFSDGIKVIERIAFGDCTGLTSLKIPFKKGITFRDYFHGDSREETVAAACEIGQNAFYGCSNIKNVVIYAVPNCIYTTDERGYLYIDYGAFLNCSGIEKIYLPRDTRRIDERAFDNCDALRDIYFEGSTEDSITVNANNTGFYNAEMHYNSSTID